MKIKEYTNTDEMRRNGEWAIEIEKENDLSDFIVLEGGEAEARQYLAEIEEDKKK